MRAAKGASRIRNFLAAMESVIIKVCVSFLAVIIVLIGLPLNSASAISYEYDELNRLTSATDLAGNKTLFAYDASGNITSTSYVEVDNLIQNGSFEAETITGVADDWDYYASGGGNAVTQVSSSPVFAGGRTQQLSVSDYNDPWQVAMISQTVDAPAGELFSLELNVLPELLDGARVLVLLEFMDDVSNVLDSYEYGIADTSETYLPYKIQGWLPVGTDRIKAGILLQTTEPEGVGNVYIDNVRLYEPDIVDLIDNGGFERYTGTTGVANAWDYYSSPGSGTAQFEVSGKFRNEGITAQKISGEGFLQWENVMISQTVQVPSAQYFAFFADVYIREVSNARVLVRLEFYDSGSSFLESRETAVDYVTNTFIPIVNSGIIPTGAVEAKLMVSLQTTANGGAGTVYVDRAGLVLPNEWDRIQNGSFERFADRNGVADDWDIYVSPESGTALFRVVGGPVAESKRSQRIDATGFDQWENAMISQYADIGPEESFKLSYQINARKLDDIRVLVLLEFYDQYDQFISSLEKDHVETTAGFASFVWEDDIPAEAAKVKIAFSLQTVVSGGTGTIYIDDVRFYLN